MVDKKKGGVDREEGVRMDVDKVLRRADSEGEWVDV